MNATIKDLKAQAKDLYAKARKLDKAVDALQEICEHDWKYDGHGHNSDYYTCLKCGKTMHD